MSSCRWNFFLYDKFLFSRINKEDEKTTNKAPSKVFNVGISSQIKYPKIIPKTSARYFNGETRETSDNLKD